MYAHLMNKMRFQPRFCTVHTQCINIIFFLDFPQSNSSRKGGNSQWKFQQYTKFHNNKNVCMLIAFKMVLLCTRIKYLFEKDNSFFLLLILWYIRIVVKKSSIIYSTTDDMTSKFALFSNIKINNRYLTESMWINWLQMLDEYRDEKPTP